MFYVYMFVYVGEGVEVVRLCDGGRSGGFVCVCIAREGKYR